MDKEQIKECQKSTGAVLLQEILVISHIRSPLSLFHRFNSLLQKSGSEKEY